MWKKKKRNATNDEKGKHVTHAQCRVYRRCSTGITSHQCTVRPQPTSRCCVNLFSAITRNTARARPLPPRPEHTRIAHNLADVPRRADASVGCDGKSFREPSTGGAPTTMSCSSSSPQPPNENACQIFFVNKTSGMINRVEWRSCRGDGRTHDTTKKHHHVNCYVTTKIIVILNKYLNCLKNIIFNKKLIMGVCKNNSVLHCIHRPMRSITYVLCRKKSSAWGPIRSQFGEHVGPHQHAQHNLQWWRTCTEGRRWLPSRSNGDWRRSAYESGLATRTVRPDRQRPQPITTEVDITRCRTHCVDRRETFGPQLSVRLADVS